MYLHARHIMPLGRFPLLASETLFSFAGNPLCYFCTSCLEVCCINVFTNRLLGILQLLI